MSLDRIRKWKSWPMPAKLIVFGLSISMTAIASLTALQQRAVREAAIDGSTYTLRAVSTERADRVADLFHQLRRQVALFADDRFTRTAMAGFNAAFDALPAQAAEAGLLARAEPALQAFFATEFGRRLRDAGQPDRGPAAYMPRSEAGRIAQLMYIADNPAPVGKKDNFAASPLANDYNALHASFHPLAHEIREFTTAYDIFLIDPEGDVIYSVFKESDFATNLLSGPYASSGLGESFRGARSLGKGEVYTTDFADYEPSYGAPAIFIATPIFEGTTRIGVACFQFPVDKINDYMAGSVGETGRVLLIGRDGKLRSTLADRKEDRVGATVLDSDAGRAASSGRDGSLIAPDADGVGTLAAFGPVEIDGLEWSAVALMDIDEVLRPARAMLSSALLEAGVLVVLSAIASFWFARKLSKPIIGIARRIREAEASNDLTMRLRERDGDELSILGAAFNGLMSRFMEVVSDVNQAAADVSGAATEISATADQMASGLTGQESQTTEVSAAVEEMSSSVAGVAEKSADAAAAAESAGADATRGGEVVRQTIAEIRAISEQVNLSADAVKSLGKKSEQIGQIIAVIDEIAEQTNLLALNAAIEAARAGEHGRGFAVVADEVRKLAERTQQATEQVARSIREIQTETKGAVDRIEEGTRRVEVGVEKATLAGGSLDRILDGSATLKSMVDDIARAIDEQRVGTEQIARATTKIAAVTRESASSAMEAASASVHLSRQSELMLELTRRFKIIPEAPLRVYDSKLDKWVSAS